MCWSECDSTVAEQRFYYWTLDFDPCRYPQLGSGSPESGSPESGLFVDLWLATVIQWIAAPPRQDHRGAMIYERRSSRVIRLPIPDAQNKDLKLCLVLLDLNFQPDNRWSEMRDNTNLKPYTTAVKKLHLTYMNASCMVDFCTVIPLIQWTLRE